MNPEAIPAAVIFAIAFADGAWQTWKLRKNWRAIAKWIRPERRGVGRAFVVVSSLVVVAVGWLGFVTVRRLLGFDPLDWSAIVSYAVALPVLFIPRYLARVWERVG